MFESLWMLESVGSLCVQLKFQSFSILDFEGHRIDEIGYWADQDEYLSWPLNI